MRINQNAVRLQLSFDLASSLIGGEASDLNIAQHCNVDFARLAYAGRAGKFGSIEYLDIQLIAGTDGDGWWAAGLLIRLSSTCLSGIGL